MQLRLTVVFTTALLTGVVKADSATLEDAARRDDVFERGASCNNRVNNTHKKLQACVTLEGVRDHQFALQQIADANGGVRPSGSPGYDRSVDYVAEALAAAGYGVELQTFTFPSWRALGPSTLEQLAPVATTYDEGSDYGLMSQTDPGAVTGFVTGVDLRLTNPSQSTSGCEPADFTGFPSGNIALIQRGACTFRQKAEIAAAFGAVGVIVFNQGDRPERRGVFASTLTSAYSGGIPVLTASFDRGAEWATAPGLRMTMVADVFRGDATTANVIAETPSGDPDHVIMAGAHLDSVNAGPGIQDNGSASAALLEIALQMKKVRPRNKVRFAWWAAEEVGLIGSTYYVSSLGTTGAERVAAYLNFDMIGSPNFVRFVLDGDGSQFGRPGPPGSEVLEAMFHRFYAERGLPAESSRLDLRSDYVAFFFAGIPVGGLFTGAEGIKTPEQALIYGGVAGEPYDPCYHLACDTFDNVSLEVLDQNADAIAYAVLQLAMNSVTLNGARRKSSLRPLEIDDAAREPHFHEQLPVE